jgi:osmoprotectant transport system permease protein
VPLGTWSTVEGGACVTARGDWLDVGWMADHRDLIFTAFRAHVSLTATAVAIGFAVSLPLGLAAHRVAPLRSVVLGVSSALYTIPSLAMFALLVPYTGLTRTTSLIPLVMYTPVILVRNIVSGLGSVPAEVLDAANGMGYAGSARLWRVELPLALPVIMAGIRLTAVSTIGLVTVTATIGENSLGLLIRDGFERDIRAELLAGLVLSLALGVVTYAVLALLERALTPWTRSRLVSAS